MNCPAPRGEVSPSGQVLSAAIPEAEIDIWRAI